MIFSSPDLMIYILTSYIAVVMSRLNQKGMPQNFRDNLKLKWGDIKTVVESHDLEGQEGYNMLKNIDHAPVESNFCDKHRNTHSTRLQWT
jgi:predicted transcriptional regulator